MIYIYIYNIYTIYTVKKAFLANVSEESKIVASAKMIPSSFY